MLTAVRFVTLISCFPCATSLIRPCVPNTQFQLKDRVCSCDNLGRWSESSCLSRRRETCLPGQIIWHECSQCICQEDRQLLCTNLAYTEDKLTTPLQAFDDGPWCTPYRSYYVNCSVCVCSASGQAAEARCARDASCSFKDPPAPSDFLLNKNICIPKVMYLFPCMHCLCSNEGYFSVEKCVETCQKQQQTKSPRRCIPRTFYKNGCNVCYCPESSFRDAELCSKVSCKHKTKFRGLLALRNKPRKCLPHKFTDRKCFYCECNSEGNINKNACLERNCLNTKDVNYDIVRDTCSPGEMVPVCMECFCLRNKITNIKYCTDVCSFQTKFLVLERLLKEKFIHRIIDRSAIKKITVNEFCDPGSVYLDHGRYCLCPENGNTNFKLCASINEKSITKPNVTLKENKMVIDLNKTCEPNTFVEFDCNTCYCDKNGKINSKWCTYDDCEAKRVVQRTHNIRDIVQITVGPKDACTPGSISKVDCNFCICPDSGFLKDRACTKNKCGDLDTLIDNAKFVCEPLAYYVVDCNVCFCPIDGLKNVAKCTKNHCEKKILRTDSCEAGELFCHECNVCVCPPNGDKMDKVCTNHTCSDTDTTWKKIFKLSQSLLGNQPTEDTTRSLDLCFPGEEFVVGCKICVCPEMGLREYASCTPTLCDDKEMENHQDISESEDEKVLSRTRREGESCLTYNLTDSSERKECTPGSMYIIRCRQCICPYMGNINHFCRPLPKGKYCEQAFPYFNYLPMGRRGDNDNSTNVNDNKFPKQIAITHNHTKYKCDKPGRVMDDCFVCECEEDKRVIIEEHCFKSDEERCAGTFPTFLERENKFAIL